MKKTLEIYSNVRGTRKFRRCNDLFARMIIILPLMSCAAYSHVDCHQDTKGVQDPDIMETIINDMKLPHEGKLHGVPEYYDWAIGPVLHRSNDAKGYQAILAWGQVYEDVNSTRVTNVRIQIRDIRTYVFSKRNYCWHLVQASELVEGKAFSEDFQGNISKQADIRHEKNGGGISVTAGGGFNFHFWAPERAAINPHDIGGIYMTVRARLILNDTSQPGGSNKAQYLLGIGGDFWRDLYADGDNFESNDAIGVGRHKYVTKQWQSFNMITLSEADVRRNPPPIE